MTRHCWDQQYAHDVVGPYGKTPGGLLPALRAVQDAFGYVDDECIPLLAQAFNLTGADILGVISFYRDFKRTPPDIHLIKVCHGEACQAVGAQDLDNAIKQRLKMGPGRHSPDGKITLERVYCLGNCALPPSILVDRTVHGRMTAQSFDAVIKDLKT